MIGHPIPSASDRMTHDQTSAAPAENVSLYDPALIRADMSPPFFAVSIAKLVVLSVCTFGLYEVWWFYRHWRLARESGEDVWPVVRALFMVFFIYALFRRIRRYPDGIARREAGFPAGPLAFGWIVVSLLYGLPDPYWLVSFGAVVFLVPMQMSANRINLERAPLHDRNTRFSVFNWIVIVVGGLIFALTVFGAFLPATVPTTPPGVTRL